MKSGDLVFIHGKGFISRAIRVAERCKKPWRRGSYWNHVAILDQELPGDWSVIQAEARGVTATGKLSDLAPCILDFAIVEAPEGVTRDKVLEFARSQVGRSYGFLTILSILFTLFTPQWIAVLVPNTWICSAVGAEAWRAGGWIHSWNDERQVSPAQLWVALRG